MDIPVNKVTLMLNNHGLPLSKVYKCPKIKVCGRVRRLLLLLLEIRLACCRWKNLTSKIF